MVDAVRGDLADGKWDAQYGHLRELEELQPAIVLHQCTALHVSARLVRHLHAKLARVERVCEDNLQALR